MMPVTDRAQTLQDSPGPGARTRPRPALRPIGARETALVAVLALALGLATAVLLPPDLVPAGGAAQETHAGR